MLDDEQTAEDVAFVDAHLAGCADCRTALDRMAALARWMRIRPAEQSPHGWPTRALALPAHAPEPDRQAAACPSGVRLVGAAACGCAASCSCGCQDGRACACMSHAA